MGTLAFAGILAVVITAVFSEETTLTIVVGCLVLLIIVVAVTFYLLKARDDLAAARLRIAHTEAAGSQTKRRLRAKTLHQPQAAATVPHDAARETSSSRRVNQSPADAVTRQEEEPPNE